uniref:Ribosomal protein L20 n=1 Tax=Sirodotia delicatula TaxID=386631 RepID=A0A343UY52_9FLOR|nr:ribosomal protein L20 [Sirodotia delicatula]AVK39609.1 ribosomal protein L20 [Sirodotia delicatula]
MNSLGSCPKKCRFESYLRNRVFNIRIIMRRLNLIKKEATKTHHRKFKKRNFSKVKTIQLSSISNLLYIKYNVLLNFIHNQKYGMKSCVFAQLLIEEIDTFFMLNYWLKFYRIKLY